MGGAQMAAKTENRSMQAFNFFMAASRAKNNHSNVDNQTLAANQNQTVPPQQSQAMVDHHSEEIAQGPLNQPVVPPAPGFDNSGSHEGSNEGFRCKTCGRGPPHTKKYAKNQCQTCYKKEKKI